MGWHDIEGGQALDTSGIVQAHSKSDTSAAVVTGHLKPVKPELRHDFR
ncbi:hypothetical protein [Phyllobacterium sp. UNC302MFCol5.2]|nr:hypothetical protein [Phyllobacterium sp. UNC302MFCol5.2]